MSKKNSKSKPAVPNNNEPIEMIKENANYSDSGKVKPINDIFYDEKCNPLSSKGN